MNYLTNTQKTVRFWCRLGYGIICLALAVAVISLNYDGCGEITGIRRGVSIGTILFWLIILMNTIYNRTFELELIYRPDSLMASGAENAMNENSSVISIIFIILFLFNLPIMLYYKLYDPDIHPSCEYKHGYNTLLALLILNLVPLGINLLLYSAGFITLVAFFVIRNIGFWAVNYIFNYTVNIIPFLGKGLEQPINPAEPPNPQIILDIEVPTASPQQTPGNNSANPSQNIKNQVIECPICLDEKDIFIKIVCGHHICIVCASKWFPENQSCPICRDKISATQL